MSKFSKVAVLSDIPKLGARVFRSGDLKIAVFRAADDKVFAVEDRCPHKNGPLSQGIVHGCRVTCPLHNLVIDLATGDAIAPDEGKTRVFPVRLEGENVMLDLSALPSKG